MSEHVTLIELRTDEWSRAVLQALRCDAQRMTSARYAIVEWIADQRRPFSAEALSISLTNQTASVGRATVYRTVDWLRDHGWLARVQTERGDYTYTRTLPGHHHHAICTHCGATILLEGCTMLESLGAILACQGFQVTGHIVEIFGLCTACGHGGGRA